MLRFSKYFILFLLVIIVNSGRSQSNYDFEISKNLDIYYSLWKQLNLYYADDLPAGKLNKTAIDEMLKSLDPYTNYFPESDIEDARFIQTGKYGGIGSSVHISKDTIVVTMPFKDFPFYNAGLRAGDKLLSIDNQSIVGKSLDEVSDKLHGASGTKFQLHYLSSKNELKTVEIKRTEIEIKNVPFYGMLNKNTAYIKLSGFTEKASQEVLAALDSLSKSNVIENLVFDLRDNGGGLLQQAVEIVGLFVPANELIVSTKGKNKSQNYAYTTTKNPKYPNLKIAVLVNGRSASASEIVAGSLQDLDRAVIIGQKSFGKGLVQKIFPLSYNAQVKITVAKYYIPSGRCIQAIDYDHRDENGEAHKIADSLVSIFKTKNGRIVKDAGGIIPDIPLPTTKNSLLIKELENQWILFDFVTEYVQLNPQTPDLNTFEISDALFNSFLSYLKNRNFEYKLTEEKMLENLISSAKKDTNDVNILQQLTVLQESYRSKKQEDLSQNKEEIKQMLRIEIISRYYFESGAVQSNLFKDQEVQNAANLLLDSNRYSTILKP